MHAWRLSLTILAAATTTAPVHAQNLFALPIAPGGPGKGPWTIAVWPERDCTDCAQTDADRAGFALVRDAIVSGNYTGIDTSGLVIHLLPERPFSPADERATPAELHALIASCEVGSQGILRQSRDNERGVAYGLGFDCPGVDHRHWMSVSFVDGRLTHIYYQPRDPIWVAPPAD
jgi:hypothetical protein